MQYKNYCHFVIPITTNRKNNRLYFLKANLFEAFNVLWRSSINSYGVSAGGRAHKCTHARITYARTRCVCTGLLRRIGLQGSAKKMNFSNFSITTRITQILHSASTQFWYFFVISTELTKLCCFKCDIDVIRTCLNCAVAYNSVNNVSLSIAP